MISNPADQEKKKVLFLCTHNSARSQMAEGLLRVMYGDRYQAYSAGVEATSVDPRAVQAMLEIGIDISGQRSKSSQEFWDTIFDLAVTVCDRARQACPICSTQLELPSKSLRAREVIHRSFEDPTLAAGSEEEQLEVFRRIRDEIKDWISQNFGIMPGWEAFVAEQDIIGMAIGFFYLLFSISFFPICFQFQVKGIADHGSNSNYYPQDYYFIQAGLKNALYQIAATKNSRPIMI